MGTLPRPRPEVCLVCSVRCRIGRPRHREEQAGPAARPGRTGRLRRGPPADRRAAGADPVRRAGAGRQEGRAAGDRRHAAGRRAALDRHGRAGRAGAVAARRGGLGAPRRATAAAAGGGQPGRGGDLLRARLLGGVDRGHRRGAGGVGVLCRRGVWPATGGAPSVSKSFAAAVFDLPGGRYLVALGGVGLVVGGAYAVYRGIKKEFLRELDVSGEAARASRVITRIGQVGWAALGFVYGLPGVLLVVAGL